MKNILLLFLLFAASLSAQSMLDRTWILGYYSAEPPYNNEVYGGMYLRFIDSVATVEKFDIYCGGVVATANDSFGNPIFYATNCSIFNNKNQLMENGDSIGWGATDHSTECSNFNEDLGIKSGSVILPKPQSSNQFYFFHLAYKDGTSVSYVYDRFLLSEIDMSANGGLGKVGTKNKTIIADSLIDAIAVARHGNGRDWWIVIPRGTNRQFYKILLTPEGPQTPIIQTLPPPYTPFTAFEPQFEYSAESSALQASFSPDGTKYCRAIVYGGDVEIYDFDRCTGELSLIHHFPLPKYDYDFPQYNAGVAISPNSRYLYFNNAEALYQTDLCDPKLKSGNPVLIEKWDQVNDTFGFFTNFFQMRNAPDGKIYMNSPNGTHFLHVINAPNEPGTACDFVQRGIRLPRWNGWLLNYFPNFNLYDLKDSPCDTIGIDDPYRKPWEGDPLGSIQIFPNPTDESFSVYIPKCGRGHLRAYDVAGRLVYERSDVRELERYVVDTRYWAAGLYFISVQGTEKKPMTVKLVVAH